MTTFRFDPSKRELHGRAGRARVEPQVSRLLAALLRTPGEVVPYAAVVAAIWPAPVALPRQPGPGVRVVIGRLRVALRRIGAKQVVQTFASIGLRFPSASVPDQGRGVGTHALRSASPTPDTVRPP